MNSTLNGTFSGTLSGDAPQPESIAFAAASDGFASARKFFERDEEKVDITTTKAKTTPARGKKNINNDRKMLNIILKTQSLNPGALQKIAISNAISQGGTVDVQGNKILVTMPAEATLNYLNSVNAGNFDKATQIPVPEKLLANEAKNEDQRMIQTEIVIEEKKEEKKGADSDNK